MSTNQFDFTDVHPVAVERVRPFFEKLVSDAPAEIVSIYATGSAVTPDFNPVTSDVNSLLVLGKIELPLLTYLSWLGRQYGKRGVRAPLLMTPEYIDRSLDVFPVEFLDLQLVSHLVFGKSLLFDRVIDRDNVRLQCEREFKGRVIALRQEYIRALGDRRLLHAALVQSLAGLIPLLRGLLFALGKETPKDRAGIFTRLREAAGVDLAPLEKVIRLKGERLRLPVDALNGLFVEYYETILKLTDVADAAT